jgi:hypothetical protein
MKLVEKPDMPIMIRIFSLFGDSTRGLDPVSDEINQIIVLVNPSPNYITRGKMGL